MIEEIKSRLSDVQENVLLAQYTTFKIGGPARYFFVAKTSEDARRAVKAAVEFRIPYFVLGGGSNILVSDQGFTGLVIQNQIKGFETREEGDRVLVTVGAGENWDELVARCVERNLAGLECLSGIPGTVGAGPVQNIGAYGQSVDAVIQEVRAIDCKTLQEVVFSREACAFAYRDSVFKKEPGHFVITQVIFLLTPGGKATPTYHDLQNYFLGRPTPTLADIRTAVVEIRARKGYVIMPEYECFQTAGSFFMNPILSPDQFQKLQSTINGCPEPWYWPLSNGRIKVSAACLLQSAGFPKGYRKGQVGISPKHSLSIVNFDNASAREVVALAQDITTRVNEKFGIGLEPEVQLVGDF